MRRWRLLLVVPVMLLGGCSTVSYYSQAVSGELHLLAQARPIDQWIGSPETPATLKEKLETARQIRRYASRELALPDNGTFTSYADLHRPYVVWDVFAAPEFSVKPRKECYPFVGCVSYRGFFSEAAARRYVERLRKQGYDVYMGGVPAYSTLGWFNDPLLSTFLGYPDWEVARIVFHELAHQVVYVKNDTAFDESFAVTVEEEGVRRWLHDTGRSAELPQFLAAEKRREELAERVSAARKELEAVYGSGLSPAEKRARKAQVFARLRKGYENYVPARPNNGFLVAISVYTRLVPAFKRLLAESGGDFKLFYARVKELAASAPSNRGPLSEPPR